MLSEKAFNYLNNLPRNLALTRSQILETFEANQIYPYEPLIHFQENYGGYEYFGSQFSIIHGGGYPFNSKIATIEEDHYGNRLCFLLIVDEMAPVRYYLDENGKFYNTGTLLYNSFEEAIEDFSDGIGPWDR